MAALLGNGTRFRVLSRIYSLFPARLLRSQGLLKSTRLEMEYEGKQAVISINSSSCKQETYYRSSSENRVALIQSPLKFGVW